MIIVQILILLAQMIFLTALPIPPPSPQWGCNPHAERFFDFKFIFCFRWKPWWGGGGSKYVYGNWKLSLRFFYMLHFNGSDSNLFQCCRWVGSSLGAQVPAEGAHLPARPRRPPGRRGPPLWHKDDIKIAEKNPALPWAAQANVIAIGPMGMNNVIV